MTKESGPTATVAPQKVNDLPEEKGGSEQCFFLSKDKIRFFSYHEQRRTRRDGKTVPNPLQAREISDGRTLMFFGNEKKSLRRLFVQGG